MLWIGQFGLVDGQPQEDSPWVGLFPDSERVDAAEAADLYVLVEPALAGSEEYCRDLAQAIGERFRQERLSLSGGMLRALTAAHEQMRDWNRRSLKQHRVAAGVSCLALRPDGRRSGRSAFAYLGQVAPSAAAFLRGGLLTRLEPRLPDAAEPLGLHEEFRPDFSRHDLAEGDRLLLLSAALSAEIDDEELSEALSLPPDEALPSIYRKASGLANCAAVLVAALEEAVEP
jgi:hypothetical protein